MRAVLVAALLIGAPAAAADAPTIDVVGLLREFGFPIFVAVWFMWRLEKRLDRFTETLEKLFTVVTVTAKIVDGIEARPARPQAPPGPAAPPGLPGIDAG